MEPVIINSVTVAFSLEVSAALSPPAVMSTVLLSWAVTMPLKLSTKRSKCVFFMTN